MKRSEIKCLLPDYSLLSRGWLDGKMKLMIFVYSSVGIRIRLQAGQPSNWCSIPERDKRFVRVSFP